MLSWLRCCTLYNCVLLTGLRERCIRDPGAWTVSSIYFTYLHDCFTPTHTRVYFTYLHDCFTPTHTRVLPPQSIHLLYCSDFSTTLTNALPSSYFFLYISTFQTAFVVKKFASGNTDEAKRFLEKFFGSKQAYMEHCMLHVFYIWFWIQNVFCQIKIYFKN